MIGIGTDFANLSGERSYSLSYYTKRAPIFITRRLPLYDREKQGYALSGKTTGRGTYDGKTGGAAGIALILSGLLRPRLMKGKKSHEIQGDPV